MATLKKLIKYITDSDYRFLINANKGKYNYMADEEYLKRRYRACIKKELHLENPKTYNEKIQWLKLYDRKPEYTVMVDKYAVKKYVADIIGEEYIIPTLGVWDTFEEIDFDKLPQQFVLKCTHDSGGLVICNDKSKFDMQKAKSKIEKSLNYDFYLKCREWPYKDVPRKVIAEKFMQDKETGELRDYKFFCFNGEPKIMLLATARQIAGETTKFDYFDMDFNHLDMRTGHPNADVVPQMPGQFELMKELAVKLSAGFAHVRVDFYEVDGKVYFGELTLYPAAGFSDFEPDEWDYTLGSWITLPSVKDIK